MYAVSTFARKYARGGSGLIRSWRVQPASRSCDPRPLESIALIVPNDASPTM